MSEKLPVVAAIVNYNMAAELEVLLPQVAEQGYDEVYVLDDASTDHSRETVRNFRGEVNFIAGRTNKGAGANRNRILQVLGGDALVHFLDTDSHLETERLAEVVRDVVPSEPFGFVGGLSIASNGFQTPWNYGPRQSLKADLGANIQAKIGALLEKDPVKAAKLRQRYSQLLSDWPDPLAVPTRREVYWNIEQCLVVRAEVFAKIGGFDERLREHEVQDLAIRMSAQGLRRYFDPLLAVRHTEGQVRGYNRMLAMLVAELTINRKHGIKNWLLARDASKMAA